MSTRRMVDIVIQALLAVFILRAVAGAPGVIHLMSGLSDSLIVQCGRYESMGGTMDPTKRKQIVYRYNADPSTDEIVEDLEGEITVPEKGGFIKRTEKQWKVVNVFKTFDKGTPVHTVFLTDNF